MKDVTLQERLYFSVCFKENSKQAFLLFLCRHKYCNMILIGNRLLTKTQFVYLVQRNFQSLHFFLKPFVVCSVGSCDFSFKIYFGVINIWMVSPWVETHQSYKNDRRLLQKYHCLSYMKETAGNVLNFYIINLGNLYIKQTKISK